MKALILIGGYGTRLRPLTLSILKPLVEFCNRPMLVHQIEALVSVGINEIILAIHREAECIEDSIRHSVALHFSYEDEHLGTAGPLAQAAPWLKNLTEPFFVLNSDIICNYPFQRMLDFHNSHGKEGTMAVTKVEEPSRFGAVVYNDHSGGVLRFVEKPCDFVANKVNAGLYIFNSSVLNRIELRPTSIEVEIFPRMVEDGQLYCIEFSGFWMDIGRPEDFIQGMRLYLSHLYESKLLMSSCPPRSKLLGNVLIHPSAKIGENCCLGPNVTIGSGVIIENGVRIRHSAILNDAVVRSHAWIDHCIVGWRSVVGRWVRMENVTVLGEDVQVNDEVALNGALVLPHNSISESVFDPQVIM
ncbi:unnamed protein product [Schistocephalus solidus]|uniref:mannose-1-phosphate guanylyltransferase n=1 Tax=Schistocephalus solidus TaxID=70667 RepID=A0A183TKV3_SCHSO|nr:unnamed protein product [Schistocephalus solidus]